MGFETADFRIQGLDTDNPYDVTLITEFLAASGFVYDRSGVDYTMILYNLNNQIIASGSYLKNVLKYVSVAPQFRETAAFAQVVTHLNDRLLNLGEKTVLVFTLPENSIKFQGLGFEEIARVEPLYALLEVGYYTIRNYKAYLHSVRLTGKETAAAVVVNCNPFTNGHLYLIEKAAAENDCVYVLVVEEDRSVFPFEKRFLLVQQGTAHLNNVVLVKGGNYVVSGATFPAYFLKNEALDHIARKQTELDLAIFIKHIAPELGISKRYVGTENYCSTTAAYNEAMKRLLPQAGIELIEVPRKTADANFISASKVREALKSAEPDKGCLEKYLPASTLAFLKSPEGAAIIAEIKSRESRH